MSSRTGLRLWQSSRALRTPLRMNAGRSFQSTDAAPPQPAHGLLSKLWNSPVGVKTVHFWAPVMKASIHSNRSLSSKPNNFQWSVVLAGVSDFFRPADKLSLSQNLAITATGVIWTRWCFVIRPKNMLLAAVNFFLASVGLTQVTRIFLYQRSLSNGTISQVAESDVKDIAETTEGILKDSKKSLDGLVK
ncbi:hypothetical protein MMC20_005578 [Loxospora ochrophaea]|nr:hypothetical protein [Loxospora ochrophaea]